MGIYLLKSIIYSGLLLKRWDTSAVDSLIFKK